MGVGKAADFQRVRRRIAETWADTPGKEAALEALDQLIWQAFKASNDAA
jgi:hypothetical protein